MKQLISDKELINELENRFENNRRTLSEQLSLMAELKSVNEKLIASEGLKSNFLSNIRNEINNPIASILELAKNISEENMEPEKMQKFAALIHNEAFSLDFQLRNIFASAEIEAGESIVSPVSVNINSIVSNVIASFRHLFEKKKIILSHIHSAQNGDRFCTDAEKLHLILSNLISNAIQFTGAEGTVDVTSKIENRKLFISIKDSGTGISIEEQEIIFDRFRQLEEGSTKTYGGHGLGLTITKALLDLAAGAIRVQSVKNDGSTFSVCMNELENSDSQADVFSSDGNDFLFADNESLAF
ncbi:MAG: HAMP domain-containing sensor histidine kinase [Bacteroidota bacterium]